MRSPFIKMPARQVQSRMFAMVNSPVALTSGYVYGACTVTLHLTGGGGSGGGGIAVSDTTAGVSLTGEAGGMAERAKVFTNKQLTAAGGTVSIPARIGTKPHKITVSYAGVWAEWVSENGNDGDDCHAVFPDETLTAIGGIGGFGAYYSEITGGSSYSGNAVSSSPGYGGFGVPSTRSNNQPTSAYWKSVNSAGRVGEAKLTLKGN